MSGLWCNQFNKLEPWSSSKCDWWHKPSTHIRRMLKNWTFTRESKKSCWEVNQTKNIWTLNTGNPWKSHTIDTPTFRSGPSKQRSRWGCWRIHLRRSQWSLAPQGHPVGGCLGGVTPAYCSGFDGKYGDLYDLSWFIFRGCIFFRVYKGEFAWVTWGYDRTYLDY